MAEPLVVPARCEPGDRPGRLTVTDDRIVFAAFDTAASETVVFDVPRAESTPDWTGGGPFGRSPRLDLWTPYGRCRLHLGPAGRAVVPELRERLAAPAAAAPDGPGPRLVLTVRADEHTAGCLAFGPLLAVGRSDGVVVLWDVPARRPVRHFVHDLCGTAVTAVAFDSEGTRLATAGADGVLKVRDLRTGRVLWKRPHPGAVGAVAFEESGARVATACADGVLRVWSPRGTLAAQRPGACAATTRHVVFGAGGDPVAGDGPHLSARSPDGSLHAVADDGEVLVWATGSAEADQQ